MLERLGGRMIGEHIALAGYTLGLHPIGDMDGYLEFGGVTGGKEENNKERGIRCTDGISGDLRYLETHGVQQHC